MAPKLSSSDEEDTSPVMAAASILASAATDNGTSSTANTNEEGEGEIAAADQEKKQAPQSSAATHVTHEQRWEAMFLRLKAYKEKHGDCLVPNRYPEDTQLGSWVSAQRRQYKIVTGGGTESAAMTPERANKLKSLGFEWSTTNPRNVPWETRYKELQDFVANYGHAEVPMRWEENAQLSNWVSKQRHQYKLLQTNRPSRLTATRVTLLNELGFVWEASRRRLLDKDVRRASDDDGDDNDDDDEGETKPPARGSSRKKPRVQNRGDDGGPSSSKMKTGPPSPDARPNQDNLAAATGTAVRLLSQQQVSNPAPHFSAAAAQGSVMQSNLGLWAAMTAGQSGLVPTAPTGQTPLAAAAAMAGGAGLNPAFFLPNMMQLGAAATMQGTSGMSLPSNTFAASMMQQQQQQPGVAVDPLQISQPSTGIDSMTTNLALLQQHQQQQQQQQQQAMAAGIQLNLAQQQQQHQQTMAAAGAGQSFAQPEAAPTEMQQNTELQGIAGLAGFHPRLAQQLGVVTGGQLPAPQPRGGGQGGVGPSGTSGREIDEASGMQGQQGNG